MRLKGWGSPNSNEGTYTVVLYIYKYFVFKTRQGKRTQSDSRTRNGGAEGSAENRRSHSQGDGLVDPARRPLGQAEGLVDPARRSHSHGEGLADAARRKLPPVPGNYLRLAGKRRNAGFLGSFTYDLLIFATAVSIPSKTQLVSSIFASARKDLHQDSSQSCASASRQMPPASAFRHPACQSGTVAYH